MMRGIHINTRRPLMTGVLSACLMLATAACTSNSPSSQPATSSAAAPASSAAAAARLESLYAGPAGSEGLRGAGHHH
jgi:hypothetical protein